MTSRRAEALLADLPTEPASAQLAAEPLLSVCLITFNQAAFIREAFDGVLAQRTSFPIEVVVGDDCSSDGTTEIVRDYQRRYPDTVRALVAPENLGRHTGNGRLNFVRTLRACRGKYVALLEGDDFWTDPSKLQRQVDMLESDAGCSGSFHETAMTELDGKSIRSIVPAHQLELLRASDIVSPALCFHTSSFVARRAVLPETYPDPYYRSYAADLPFFFFVATAGTIRRVPGCMSCWRRHPGGLTGGPFVRGIEIHLERVQLWESLRTYLDETDRIAVDRTCSWHLAEVVKRFEHLEAENARLRRPFSAAARVLLRGPLRRLRSGLRRLFLTASEGS
jgi:glycosyltransferase involved in cell wall biosynthesis